MEELDIREIFEIIKKGILLIIAFMIIGAVLGYVYNTKYTTPKYQASTRIILSAGNDDEGISASELKLNKDLINTYSQILKSDRVIDKVKERLYLDMPLSELSKSITVKQENESTVIKVTVSNSDNEESAIIANEIATVFFEELKSLYNITSARTLDEAKVPSKPYNVNPVKYSLIGMAIGAIAAVALLFIKNMFNENVRNEIDIEKNINVPVLASIGMYSKNDTMVMNDKNSANSEGFRILVSNIKYLEKRVIFVLSNTPGEGKSWVSANIATTYANSGKRTLLIDFDARKGRQHNIFRLKNRRGLSDLIIENNPSDYQKYINYSVIENLDIITKGATMLDYSKLLFSNTLEVLIDMLREKYDYIIVDGTPISLVADGAAIMKAVDSTLLVVRHDTTKVSDLVKIKKRVKSMGGDIFGVVLNGVPKIGKKYKDSYYGYNKNYMPAKTRNKNNIG